MMCVSKLRTHCGIDVFMVNKNTIEEVLETIASTSRMNYRYENGKYILY